MTTDAPRYFFSYARSDSEFVLRLARELRAAGAGIWIDQLDILGGERWDQAIERALGSCQGIIVVLSPQSVSSENVMDEVSFALEAKKLIVPVIKAECEVPFRLRRLQDVKFTPDFQTGLAELLRALRIQRELQSNASLVTGDVSTAKAAAKDEAASGTSSVSPPQEFDRGVQVSLTPSRDLSTPPPQTLLKPATEPPAEPPIATRVPEPGGVHILKRVLVGAFLGSIVGLICGLFYGVMRGREGIGESLLFAFEYAVVGAITSAMVGNDSRRKLRAAIVAGIAVISGALIMVAYGYIDGVFFLFYGVPIATILGALKFWERFDKSH